MLTKMTIEIKILIISLIFFLILYTVCRMYFGAYLAKGVLVGYSISVFNFTGLIWNIKDAFGGKTVRAVVFNSQIRLIITGVVLGVLFKFSKVNIAGLLVGLSIVTITAPLYFIIGFRRNKNGTSA